MDAGESDGIVCTEGTACCAGGFGLRLLNDEMNSRDEEVSPSMFLRCSAVPSRDSVSVYVRISSRDSLSSGRSLCRRGRAHVFKSAAMLRVWVYEEKDQSQR